MSDLISSHKLNCFYHVCEHRSFRDAARRLGIAQSALSRHVQALESELGVVLFHRGRSSVEPTEAGLRLQAQAETILKALSDLRADMDDLRDTPRGKVSLAMPASFATAFLGQIVPSFTSQFRDVRLRILEGSAGQIEELLLAGRADLAIVVASSSTRALNEQLLISDQLYVVGRVPFEERDQQGLSIERLAALDLVLPLPPYGTRRLIDGVASRSNVTLKPMLEADSPHILRQLITSLDLYTIMPGISIAADLASGTLHAVPLVPSISRHLAIATVSGRATTLATRLLAQHIRVNCSSLNQDLGKTAPLSIP